VRPRVHVVLEARPVEAGVEPQPREALGEAVEVGVEAEEAPLPDVDDVVGAVRPGDTQVEHRDRRLLDRPVGTADVGGALPPGLVAVHPPGS
jgi:hypothetical protein